MDIDINQTVTTEIFLSQKDLEDLKNGRELSMKIAGTTDSDDRDMYIRVVLRAE